MQIETNTSMDEKTSSFNWRLFGILLALVAFGLLAMIPYGLTISGQQATRAALLGLIPQFFVQILLYSFLIWAGLKLGEKVGLGTEWLGDWARGEKASTDFQQFALVLVVGALAGLVMIVLDMVIFVPALDLAGIGETVHPPAWQGFLASFYGGIVEEVMMRLFLLSLLVWLGSKLCKNADGSSASTVVWAAILISWLVFSIGHLPSAVVMGIELTPLYVIRTLALNSAGILYGWLYWKRGLESAMLAHFSTDIVVHVLAVVFLT